jgi:hypothetical protein
MSLAQYEVVGSGTEGGGLASRSERRIQFIRVKNPRSDRPSQPRGGQKRRPGHSLSSVKFGHLNDIEKGRKMFS